MMQPVLARFRSLASCSSELEQRVLALKVRVETVDARTSVQAEDAPVHRPRYLLAGWACRYRPLSSGRRQIFDLALLGDGLGVGLRPNSFANTSIAALSPLRLVDAAPLLSLADEEVAALLHAQADADERRALNQMARLGGMTALERLGHLFLELHERLEVVALTDGLRFACPLTQEALADMNGLSVVHVNRTLQELRRQNLVVMARGWVRLGNPEELAQRVDYTPGGGRREPRPSDPARPGTVRASRRVSTPLRSVPA